MPWAADFGLKTDRGFVRSTAALLLIGLMALIVIMGAAFWLGIRTQSSFDDVAKSRSLRAAAIDLRSSLQDAETGQRGFLLTGRDSYLQPFADAKAAIPGQVKRLDTLVEADPQLAHPWAEEKQAVDDKIDELDRTVTLKRAGDEAGALAVVNSNKGKEVMDRARRDIGTMVDLAESRISSAVQVQQASMAGLGWVAIIGSVVIAIVVGGSAWAVLRYTGELAVARDEVAALNTGLEQRVAERTADVLAANDEIQRFAYIVTHDLRAPLVNIMGFTAELEAGVAEIRAYFEERGDPGGDPVAAEAFKATDSDLPEAIGFIRSSTRKMDGLINAILKLAREGGRVMRPERVELDRLLEASVAAIQHQLTAAAAEVRLEVTAPPVNTDKLALEQIFGNLLDNAVKYRSPTRPLEILVQARPASRDRVEIRVQDNGRGIAPQDHERVFELFRRSGAQDQPGDGIGLAFVRRVVRNLGGDISMTSELDRGTTFVVSLPRTFLPTSGKTS